MSAKDTTGSTEVRTETIESAKEMCRIFREKDIPVYLHGAPGVGKSDAGRQLATEAKIGFKDIRVGTMLPEDLTGIPVPDLEKRVATWLRAEFWPEESRDGKEGIIVFDELSDANRQLQSCIYRVILDRQIGDYVLPPGWWPMAAGNRREDRAAAQSVSTALANRFAHIHIRADAECWLQWANVNNIDPMLIGLINFRKNLLHSMEGADLLAFPSPRSWARASKVFDQPAGLRFRLVAANVGEGAAMEVETFFKTVNLPDLEDIVNQPMKTMIPDEPGSRYALCAMLSREINAENFPAIYKYINRDDFGADFATVVVLDATKRDASLCDTKTFIAWARSNKSIRV
jgi:ATPase family associated with various cellular activities (AAA)